MKNLKAIVGFTSLLLITTACAPRFAETQSSRAGGGGYGDEGFYVETEADYEYIEEEYAADGDFFPAEEPAPGLPASDLAVVNTGADGNAVGDSTVDQQVERLIIRNGNISIAAEDTRSARASVENIVAQYAGEGAFVVSSNESGGYNNDLPYINMSIRVPAEHFDEIMNSIAELGVEVYSRNESGQDVTEEYVDLSARLESLEAARDRLLDIIKDAETTEDLLLAEQQLTQREAEIESIKGRLQYLTESARLSSIYVDIQPYVLSQPIDNTWKPLVTVRRAFQDLIWSIRGFLNFIITFVIAVLPWLLFFGAIIYFIIRAIVRAWRKRQANKNIQQTNTTED